jgi:ferrous iron transport protein A
VGIKLQEIRRTELALQSLYDCMRKKLSELEPGRQAVIIALEDQDLVLKLMEMGFLEGEDIVVEQIAPLGDPISVMVSGYQVSLRINEAESILVEEK